MRRCVNAWVRNAARMVSVTRMRVEWCSNCSLSCESYDQGAAQCSS
jgi:hypothetical protein